MYIWSARHEFFLLAVVLNRYPNLTYIVVVVLVDDADEMVTYGDSNGPNRYYILFPSPLAFLYHICSNQKPH